MAGALRRRRRLPALRIRLPPVRIRVRRRPALGTRAARCVNGAAGDFSCSGIALRSRVALEDMDGGAGNDIWGWADAETGAEYALMGLTNGTAFVDVSAPEDPVFLGRLPTNAGESLWRDIKVYRDHAYIVADQAGAHGMQVFDLTRLRGLSAPQTFTADVVYGDFENAHNLAIDEATGFAYAVASNTCEYGMHIVDIRAPNNPVFRGCHPGRTHDTQCVVYRGPDVEHREREICVNSSEDHLEVVDVTDKDAPLTLSSSTYPDMAYVHQGWLTEDHRFFLLGDELDEQRLGVPTRTHVFDLSDLDQPGTCSRTNSTPTPRTTTCTCSATGSSRPTTRRDCACSSSATSGRGRIAEVAYFDTFPEGGGPGFEGAWSVYPYLPSGSVLVSDISHGLFVLAME